ncbi:hypothetical protein MRX96_049171 [Rhipicephalus microplus]
MRQRGRSLSTRCQRTWTQKGMQAGERREQRHWPVNIRETRGAVYVDAARYPGRRNASAAVVVSATTGKLLTASTVRARTAGQAVEAAIALATGSAGIPRALLIKCILRRDMRSFITLDAGTSRRRRV